MSQGIASGVFVGACAYFVWQILPNVKIMQLVYSKYVRLYGGSDNYCTVEEVCIVTKIRVGYDLFELGR